MNKKNKGFTLVELIVVLAILAILAAMLVPALTGYIDKANEKKTVATARQYYVAAQTVVSEAYAKNEVISDIMLYPAYSTESIVINSRLDDDGNPYIDEFKNLAEMGDECTFASITIADGKIAICDFVIDGTEVVYNHGEWMIV